MNTKQAYLNELIDILIGRLAAAELKPLAFRLRSARAQRNFIALAIRAFIQLECYSYATGHSWFEAKMRIIREAVRIYLENPKSILDSTA
jgi:hypothetical protein